MKGKRGETRQAIFAFVRDRVREGTPPTVREIQAAFGFKAVQTAQEHLGRLVDEGLLERDAGKSRSYRPREAAPPAPVLVPILGRVRAGPLTEALEDPDGHVAVSRRERPDGLFALRVRGDSMTGAGILEGDLVIVRRQETAPLGQIVVALVGDEVTVKRLGQERGRPVLLAENPAYAPIRPDPAEELRLLGQVVEVRRVLEP